MEVPLLLQFSIALFTGMVAATFVPSIRRSIPRLVEVSLWIALVTCCVLGIASVTDANARDLSYSVLWGVEQVVNTIFGLLLSGVWSWIVGYRFAIASWLVILAGADLLALMLLSSLRHAAPWQPRVRLREWMELPVPAPAVRAPQPAVADPLVAVNRRLAGATTGLGAAVVSRSSSMGGWLRGRMPATGLRQLSTAGRAGSRARLESVRDATAHLSFAARAWYTAAGEPALSGMAEKARALRPGVLRRGEVIDIQALLNAQSIGWYGPLSAAPIEATSRENDAADPQRPDSLAS